MIKQLIFILILLTLISKGQTQPRTPYPGYYNFPKKSLGVVPLMSRDINAAQYDSVINLIHQILIDSRKFHLIHQPNFESSLFEESKERDCSQLDCIRTIAKQQRIDYFLRGELSKDSVDHYSAKLSLHGVDLSSEEKSQTIHCQCSFSEFLDNNVSRLIYSIIGLENFHKRTFVKKPSSINARSWMQYRNEIDN